MPSAERASALPVVVHLKIRRPSVLAQFRVTGSSKMSDSTQEESSGFRRGTSRPEKSLDFHLLLPKAGHWCLQPKRQGRAQVKVPGFRVSFS